MDSCSTGGGGHIPSLARTAERTPKKEKKRGRSIFRNNN